MRYLLILLAALLPARALALDTAPLAEAVEAARTAEGIPGVSVMIARGDERLFSQGFGLANVELGTPATTQSVYQIGSLAKTFTAVGIMLLVQDGKLALDESITHYLPEAPAHWKPVTLRTLVGMRSGIADYEEASLGGGSEALIDLHRDYSDSELVTRLGRAQLLFTPGTRVQYSNSNYVVLGALITRIAGEPYTDFLTRRLFRPAGMNTARKASLEALIPNRADGYVRAEDLRNADWVSPTLYSTGDGGLMMSVDDLASWHRLLVNKTGPLAETFAPMWSVAPYPDGTRPVIGYALGWQAQSAGGLPVVGHGGTWAGYRAYFLHVPSTGLSVAVLANLESAGTGRLAWKLAGLVDPRLYRQAAASDPDPKTTQAHRALFKALLDGKTIEETMTPGAAVLWTGRARQELLDFASPVRTSQSFVLVRRDKRQAVYRLGAGRFDVVLEMALDPNRRVSGINVTIE